MDILLLFIFIPIQHEYFFDNQVDIWIYRSFSLPGTFYFYAPKEECIHLFINAE